MFFFNLEFFVILLLMHWLMNSLYLTEEYFWLFKNNEMNFWMVVLVVILYLMMLMVQINYKNSMNLLFMVLFYLMMVSDLLVFFLFYEMVFILIMFVILLLGYSYERLMAAFLMMFYSFLFSSPVLMMLMLFDYLFLIKEWMIYSNIVKYFLVGSFMVKFPIFGVHYWLPVAHVEASTMGSMMLAGVLLKLGAVGVIYVIAYMNFLVKFHWLAFSVVILMLMILMLSDLKMMIAYSSVAHMSMVFYVMMMGYELGKKGAIYMMFFHGFVSPIMFWVVGMLAWWKTRSLIIVKMMTFSYIFILMLFFLCILNMGFPPFMGFMSEILMLKVVFLNKLILLVMILSVLMSCYYNIYLFWCFNGVMGLIFKNNFFNMDVFMFLLFSLWLNLFWKSNCYNMLWLY